MPVCDGSKNATQCEVAGSWFLWRSRRADHSLSHRFSGVQFILVGKNYVSAFRETAHGLREIEGAKSNLHSALVHDAAFHDQGLIDKQGARRHEQNIFACAGRSEEHTSELQSRFDLVCRL